jgi:hypothetical protein
MHNRSWCLRNIPLGDRTVQRWVRDRVVGRFSGKPGPLRHRQCSPGRHRCLSAARRAARRWDSASPVGRPDPRNAVAGAVGGRFSAGDTDGPPQEVDEECNAVRIRQDESPDGTSTKVSRSGRNTECPATKIRRPTCGTSTEQATVRGAQPSRRLPTLRTTSSPNSVLDRELCATCALALDRSVVRGLVCSRLAGVKVGLPHWRPKGGGLHTLVHARFCVSCVSMQRDDRIYVFW